MPLAPTRDVPGFRPSRPPVLAALAAVCCVGAMSYPSHARPFRSETPLIEARNAGAFQRSAGARPATRYEEYRISAGTALPIELRTVLSSSRSRPMDPVEGRLLRAIMADDVELVPAGAVVLGTVSEAEPAGPRKPGRLSFTFTVIQHPETGSRAMIRATVLTFRTDMPNRGQPLPEIHLPKGLDATVTLLQPLLVRLPLAGRS
jgi:hypothetical protein